MSYISLAFAAFVLCLLVVYAVMPNKFKWCVLLIFSLIFYASSGLDKLVFVVGTSIVVYISSRKIEHTWVEYDNLCAVTNLSSQDKKQLKKKYASKCKRLLLMALFLSVGILCWCKFSLKVVDVYNNVTGSNFAIKIIIPLGVSYYTFSSAGYLVDIYWRTIKAEKSFPRILLCMVYFPHVVQGPIPRYEKILPQLDTLSFPSYDRFCMGLQLSLWGLIKKMVIADRMGLFVSGVFGNANKSGGAVFTIALIFAAFQMYADFSGCMDIITGISEIIGIKLDKNFDHPFLAQSIGEFWRRWHITLFNWLKDYIYMPLLTSSVMGKVRKVLKNKCNAKTIRSIMSIIPTACVFIIIGIWHDVGLPYIFQGLYWTVLFVLSSFLEDRIARMSKCLHINTESVEFHCFQSIRTFILVALSFLAYTLKNVGDIVLVLKRMVTDIRPWVFWDGSLYNYGLDQANFTLAVLSIAFLVATDILQSKCEIRQHIAKCNIALRWIIYLAGVFTVLIFGIYGPGYNAASFIYEQF